MLCILLLPLTLLGLHLSLRSCCCCCCKCCSILSSCLCIRCCFCCCRCSQLLQVRAVACSCICSCYQLLLCLAEGVHHVNICRGLMCLACLRGPCVLRTLLLFSLLLLLLLLADVLGLLGGWGKPSRCSIMLLLLLRGLLHSLLILLLHTSPSLTQLDSRRCRCGISSSVTVSTGLLSSSGSCAV